MGFLMPFVSYVLVTVKSSYGAILVYNQNKCSSSAKKSLPLTTLPSTKNLPPKRPTSHGNKGVKVFIPTKKEAYSASLRNLLVFSLTLLHNLHIRHPQVFFIIASLKS